MVRARKLVTKMPSFLWVSSETKKVHVRRRSTNEQRRRCPCKLPRVLILIIRAGVEGSQNGGEMAAERLGLEGEAAVGSGMVAGQGDFEPHLTNRETYASRYGSGVAGRTEERKERRRQSRAHPRPIINRPRYDNVISQRNAISVRLMIGAADLPIRSRDRVLSIFTGFFYLSVSFAEYLGVFAVETRFHEYFKREED